MSTRISAFVVSYNRADRIEPCLKSLRFADELIVVDKGSSDGTRRIAEGYADRLLTVPWSPTVEATRQFALTHCSHDLVVFLDDDEVLSVPGIEYILERARVRPFDALALPVRHYVLGRHDEAAYYWPERHVRAFRRGCVAFGDTVHAGITFLSGYVEEVGWETGICVHNVSYRDTHDWLEKTNRYTASPNRSVAPGFSSEQGLRAYIQDRADHWFGKTATHTPYVDAVSALRVVYDVVDVVKSLESTIGVHADSDFAAILQSLSHELDAFLASSNVTTARVERHSRGGTRGRLHQSEPSIPRDGRAIRETNPSNERHDTEWARPENWRRGGYSSDTETRPWTPTRNPVLEWTLNRSKKASRRTLFGLSIVALGLLLWILLLWAVRSR